METTPRIGIGILILKDGKVLLGKRKGSHGAGQYSFPGGHLEHLESFRDCALREIKEECGIKVENLRFQLVANITEFKPKHYVHIGIIADWKAGTPRTREPDKCESWDWYDFDNLPSPVFGPAQLALDTYNSEKCYFDIDDL